MKKVLDFFKPDWRKVFVFVILFVEGNYEYTSIINVSKVFIRDASEYWCPSTVDQIFSISAHLPFISLLPFTRLFLKETCDVSLLYPLDIVFQYIVACLAVFIALKLMGKK